MQPVEVAFANIEVVELFGVYAATRDAEGVRADLVEEIRFGPVRKGQDDIGARQGVVVTLPVVVLVVEVVVRQDRMRNTKQMRLVCRHHGGGERRTVGQDE